MVQAEAALDLAGVLEAYLGAWNESDPAERRGLLERSVSDDVVFIDPMKQIAGRPALEAHIADVRAAFPGMTFVSDGAHDEHNGFVRQPWTALQAGEVVLRGLDVDDVAADGRLARIIGFFNR